jgi:hypothetical protein
MPHFMGIRAKELHLKNPEARRLTIAEFKSYLKFRKKKIKTEDDELFPA